MITLVQGTQTLSVTSFPTTAASLHRKLVSQGRYMTPTLLGARTKQTRCKYPRNLLAPIFFLILAHPVYKM